MAVLAQWCVRFTFRDAKGQTRSVTICYQSDQADFATNANSLATIVSQTVTKLQALSNAHVQSESDLSGGAAQSGVTYGSTGEYQSVSQQARLYYLSVDPSGDPSPTATLTIPAPKASIFLADLVTVDPANAAVIALNGILNVGGSTAAASVACTKSGLLYATFIGGVFAGKKLSRKWTKYTKDPTLTIAGI